MESCVEKRTVKLFPRNSSDKGKTFAPGHRTSDISSIASNDTNINLHVQHWEAGAVFPRLFSGSAEVSGIVSGGRMSGDEFSVTDSQTENLHCGMLLQYISVLYLRLALII